MKILDRKPTVKDYKRIKRNLFKEVIAEQRRRDKLENEYKKYVTGFIPFANLASGLMEGMSFFESLPESQRPPEIFYHLKNVLDSITPLAFQFKDRALAYQLEMDNSKKLWHEILREMERTDRKIKRLRELEVKTGINKGSPILQLAEPNTDGETPSQI